MRQQGDTSRVAVSERAGSRSPNASESGRGRLGRTVSGRPLDGGNDDARNPAAEPSVADRYTVERLGPVAGEKHAHWSELGHVVVTSVTYSTDDSKKLSMDW